MAFEKSDDMDEVAKLQQHIQDEVALTDHMRAADETGKHGTQTGARPYPYPPFPAQHQLTPGLEAELDPAPMYDAPYYLGSCKLDGKVALITGGDSGIGRAVAVLFAREGADITISYVNEETDALATKDAVEAEGRRCILLPADVRDPLQCRQLVHDTINQLGALDVLVNNAAFQVHADRIEDLTLEHFDLTLKTNLYGYFNMCQAAVAHMRPGSAIVNTGSITGIEGSKSLLDYSMTKGGIHAFTKALAGNLIDRGIRVNCVAPGPVWSPLNPSDRDAESVREFGSGTKMNRPAQPEEIAPAYVFLASSHCSSFITGEILPIIGGY